jgi:hypothetical protein
VLSGFVALVIVALVIAALVIARYNLRAQRADRRGAARLATFVMMGYAASWLVAAHHVPDVNAEVNSFARDFGPVLVATSVLWLIYLAVEPYVRRFWPDGILGWTRLMSGYVHDPRVGRDVLIGCTVGVGLTVVEALYNLLPPLLGRASAIPTFQSNVTAFDGGGTLLSLVFDTFISGIFAAMFAVLGYVLLRLAFRRTSFTVTAAVALMTLVQANAVLTSAAPMWMAALFQLCVIATVTTIIVRYGLLVTAMALSVFGMLDEIPLTMSLSHWTATTSNLAIAVVLAITLFGFYASRAGQPLFGKFEV